MFHVYRQHDATDCGVACLRMIARHYGKKYTEREMANLCHSTRNGVSLLDISEAAHKIGLDTMGVKLSTERLATSAPMPCILHWAQHHFVVCYKVSRRHGTPVFHIADPASKRLAYTADELRNCWSFGSDDSDRKGVALLIKPTKEFFAHNPQSAGYSSLQFLSKYFSAHRRTLVQILFAMLVVSGIQLAAPFLTQTMVDVGIGRRDMGIVTLVLIAQLTVLVSTVVVGMTRNWLTLYMNTRINISLVSDFLMKMMRMPLHFFDTKLVGDLTQRLRDNERIESFLTGTSVETMFSMVNFVVFAAILAYYDTTILLTFILGNSLYVVWTQCLMRYRRDLDLKRFNQLADEQDVVLQMINGIRDIKLYGCERPKMWEWERLQAKIFNTKSKTLAVAQLQQFGAVLFSQSTSIFITYLAARDVVAGSLTIGSMMAMSYIIAQLSAPIGSFVDFMCSLQYARLSLDRLSELHESKDDSRHGEACPEPVPDDHTIRFENVWFSYSGSERKYVLRNVCLTIPDGKTTAIVGASGCGKTTLLKMILGFYQPGKGNIYVGDKPLCNVDLHKWRTTTGCVLQDGYVFSSDIAHNIALADGDDIDRERMRKAAKAANIDTFVESLPFGYNTKVGMDGSGLSQGQKQRLLIARLLYKSPQVVVLDEATNALDSRNEREIVGHLQESLRGKTVIIAAHRLSTIMNADNIAVIADGHIIEQGTHEQLLGMRGEYYNLVINQIRKSNGYDDTLQQQRARRQPV